MMFRSLAVGAGLALLLTTTLQPAIAQSAFSPSEAAVQELIRANMTPETLERLYAEATEQATAGFQSSFEASMGRELTGSESERLYQFWNRQVREVMTAEALTQILTPVYLRYFTLEEVTQINQFYSTPTGAKLSRLSLDSDQFTPAETAQLDQFFSTPTGAKLYQLSPTLIEEARNASNQLAGEVMSDQVWLNGVVADLQAEFPEWFR